MRVLVSVGALMNLLSDKESCMMEVIKLLESIDHGNIDGYVTTKSLKQFLHEAETSKGFKESVSIVYYLLEILKQCPDEETLFNQAQSSNLEEFEILEVFCANSMDLGAIITENPEYFLDKTDLNILSTKECLKRLVFEEIYSNTNQAKYYYQQNPEIVNLMQWLNGQDDTGWQAVQELVNPQLRPAFRNDELNKQERAKLIDLGLELDDRRVALIMTVQEKDDNTVTIRSQVYPTGEEIVLPPNLKMSVLTDTSVFKEVTARSNDEFIQYEFEAEVGDSFGIQVALGEVSLTEKFRV